MAFAYNESMTTVLPASALGLLPDIDRNPVAEQVGDDLWVVAGTHALILTSATAVIDSAMWYEAATAQWEAETRQLSVTWVDPQRPDWMLTTVSEDPHVLMRTISDHVNHSIVIHKALKVSNGTQVAAWIRRAEDGKLFSVLIALGPLDEASQKEADAFERDLRESVGLD